MTKYLVTKDNGFFSFTPNTKYEVVAECEDRYIIVNDQNERVKISVFNKWWTVIEESDKAKTWGEMTDAEKGALLLAHHEGTTIEYSSLQKMWWVTLKDPAWVDNVYYRIKPEPVVGEVVLTAYYDGSGPIYFDDGMSDPTNTLILPTLDGNLVCGEFTDKDGNTVKVEEK